MKRFMIMFIILMGLFPLNAFSAELVCDSYGNCRYVSERDNLADTAFQIQQSRKQDWRDVGKGLSRLGQSLERIADENRTRQIEEASLLRQCLKINRAREIEEAGKKLFKMGLNEKNLRIIVNEFDLSLEETRDLVVSYTTLQAYMNKQNSGNKESSDSEGVIPLNQYMNIITPKNWTGH